MSCTIKSKPNDQHTFTDAKAPGVVKEGDMITYVALNNSSSCTAPQLAPSLTHLSGKVERMTLVGRVAYDEAGDKARPEQQGVEG